MPFDLSWLKEEKLLEGLFLVAGPRLLHSLRRVRMVKNMQGAGSGAKAEKKLMISMRTSSILQRKTYTRM
jgi:hypothetical protein